MARVTGGSEMERCKEVRNVPEVDPMAPDAALEVRVRGGIRATLRSQA